MKPTDINWVAANPQKRAPRLKWELDQLKEHHPQFKVLLKENGEMYVEGKFVTMSRNIYTIRAYYPKTYPNDKIIACVMDGDVVAFCKNQGMHSAHNFGEHADGGIMLCMVGPGEWTPEYSIMTILQLTSVWLHSMEVKKQTGEWIWPEAK